MTIVTGKREAYYCFNVEELCKWLGVDVRQAHDNVMVPICNHLSLEVSQYAPEKTGTGKVEIVEIVEDNFIAPLDDIRQLLLSTYFLKNGEGLAKAPEAAKEPSYRDSNVYKLGKIHVELGTMMMNPNTSIDQIYKFAWAHGMDTDVVYHASAKVTRDGNKTEMKEGE
jgi:hypothetical protein